MSDARVNNVTDEEKKEKKEREAQELKENEAKISEYEKIQNNTEQGAVFSWKIFDQKGWDKAISEHIEQYKQQNKTTFNEAEAQKKAEKEVSLPKEQITEKYKSDYNKAKEYVSEHKPTDNTAEKPKTNDNTDGKEKIDINDKDVDYALRAVPSFVQDFMKAHKILKEDHEWMNTRQLKEFLSTKEFTEEQLKTLNDFFKNKDERKAEFKAYIKDPKKALEETRAKYDREVLQVQYKVDKQKQKIADLKRRDEDQKQKIADLQQKNNDKDREIAELKAKAPLSASRGKAEVVKDNGKTKEKNAIILKDENGKEYFITRKMVKEARENDSTMLSWGDLKDTVKDGELNREIFNKLFDKDGKAKYGGYKEVKAKSADSKAPEDKNLRSTVEEIETETPTAKRSKPVKAESNTNFNYAQTTTMNRNAGNSMG